MTHPASLTCRRSLINSALLAAAITTTLVNTVPVLAHT
jgi:hypothetical protein